MPSLVFDEKAAISLRTAIPVILAIISAAFWINRSTSEIQASQDIAAVRQEVLQQAVLDLKASVAEMKTRMAQDSWTRTDMKRFRNALQATIAILHPDIKVPEVE